MLAVFAPLAFRLRGFGAWRRRTGTFQWYNRSGTGRCRDRQAHYARRSVCPGAPRSATTWDASVCYTFRKMSQLQKDRSH